MILTKSPNSNGFLENASGTIHDGAKNILGYLQDFGLTEKEALTFFVLSKAGSATAAEITGLTKFNRLQSYRAVKSLLDKGLVEISLDRPRRYTPLKIEQVLNLLRQEAEKKILELEKKTPLFISEWSAANDLQFENSNYTFRIIQGNKNVLKFRIMLYESAKKEISTTMRPNELTKLMIEGADDSFEKLNSNNVSIRGLSEVSELNLDASRRFLEFSKLNHTTGSKIVPFAVIDGQEAIICLSKDGANGPAENAIWTNHPEMVQILLEVFEKLWTESQNGLSRVREIEKNANRKIAHS